MRINQLSLITGIDIPLFESSLILHQPTIREISFIGETTFLYGYEILTFNQKKIKQTGKTVLTNQSNFDIIMSIIGNKNDVEAERLVVSFFSLMNLLFPQYTIQFNSQQFKLELTDDKGEKRFLDSSNFEELQQCVREMFPLFTHDESNYNPSGDLSSQIAKKLEERKKKLAEVKGPQEHISILSRYISILAVGEQKDINSLSNYTVYQIIDEFRRYQAKLTYDAYVQAKIAGASDLDDVEHWMNEDVHSKNKKQ